MNDKQTINYLLIIFIITNLFLGVGNYNKYIKNYTLNQNRIERITEFLEQDNITIESDLPKDHSAKPKISLIPKRITTNIRDSIVNNFFGEKREGVTITNVINKSEYDSQQRVYKKGLETLSFSTYKIIYRNFAIEKSVNSDDLLSKQKILSYAKEHYEKFPADLLGKTVNIVYELVSYGANVTYYSVYSGLPVFDSYLYMQINNDGVFMSTMTLSEVSEKFFHEAEIYAVDQVLFNLHQFINPNTIIKNITLGYARENQNSVFFLTEEAIPTYKIEIEGFRQPLFVNAYTNQIK
ncbi:two-component system regulatory protein YycI [Candidatus Epulonipiscium viviparus]|uniref:two-component system regulatory protein YycI n=1 Tax=Candidatus Epulonipiscium viviparus TaxID=420336 RepID=UPI00016BFC9E|nr:two-component system regulatory protein YycI [Candidatus Epulopiscium viviparus]